MKGHSRKGAVSFRSNNPHCPSEVLGEFEEAGPSGVETAVGHARRAHLDWRDVPAHARSDTLARIAEDIEKWGDGLARLMAREVGKPLGEARTLPDVRFHDLRHTCATILLRAGKHPKYVQELLGHATISITLDTYSHVIEGMEGGLGDAIDEALG